MISNPNASLVVVSIIALLHTCIQDCSSRPLPGEGRSSPEEWQWLSYSLEVPESPRDYTYHDMAFRSGPDSPQFPYTHIPPLHQNHAPGSSHGLHHDYHEHITNAYHQPSSSHTVEHHYSNQPSYNDMSNQHCIPLSEPEPIVEQRTVHQQGMHHDQMNHFSSGYDDMSDSKQHWNPLSEAEPIVEQQTIHQQEMYHKQMNHFTVSDSMSDMYFGWLSTLSFPSGTILTALCEDEWGLSTILSRRFDLGAIPALENNVETADRNLRHLLREIDTRNKQFLVLFTPADWDDFMATLQQHHNYHDMQDENARLLQWLLDQLEPVPQHNDWHGSQLARTLSPFQQMLFEFLNKDFEPAEFTTLLWQPNPRESMKERAKKSATFAPANRAMADCTRIAINALGTYYKSSNPSKFYTLFFQDWYFANNFLLMKAREHNSASSRYFLEKWVKLAILPWKDPHQFHPDAEATQALVAFKRFIRGSVKVTKKFGLIPPS